MDEIDRRILNSLQQDGSQSQRELADKIGMSQNACWRRVQRMKDAGILCGTKARVDARAAGLPLTVFVTLRTRNHNKLWVDRLKRHVLTIPEVTEMHRIGGEWDYMLKVVTTDMAGYDRVYRALIEHLDLDTVTGLFSMETLFEDRPLVPPLALSPLG